MNTSTFTTNKYRECTVLAPAQIANCFGPLDRIGMLGRRPPFSPEEREGGPGNYIHVRRLPDKSNMLNLHIDLRECDERGYWKPPRRFDDLLAEIEARPERDLVRILARLTLRYLSRLIGHRTHDGLNIHIVIHTPNGKTGLGLGGSASSAAIVIAIDALFGFPITSSPNGEQALLRLMGKGEQIVAGTLFYDNVAPLAVGADAVYLRPGPDANKHPSVTRLTCPQSLHIVTITPDYELSTKLMNEILEDKTIRVREAEAAAASYMDVRHALDTGDLDLLIRSAGNKIVEPIRGTLIPGLDTLREVVRTLNDTYDASHPRFACGISGSGPTMYVLTDSQANADRVGYETYRALREQGIASWWFWHRPNPNGAEIIELR